MPQSKRFLMQQSSHNKNATRLGPRPLWLHLNAGAAMLAAASDTESMFGASSILLKNALAGVKAYHENPTLPFYRSTDVISDVMCTRAITDKSWGGNNVVILIPSLINSWHIFDIEKNHSFADYLSKNSLKPIIVDWAKPLEKNISLDDYIIQHLKPLIDDILAKGYNIKGLVGYCMGGTIIAALLSAFPELESQIGNIVFIASPWDFSYQSVEQMTRLQTMAIQSYALSSPVPTDFVQSLFWAIDPLQIIKKFRRFPNVKNPERFVRIEDWLNEGREVSLSVIQTCLFDWYRDNKINKGQWLLNGNKVMAKAISNNVMIIVGKKDNLVPLKSVLPLIQELQPATYIEVDTGHIGLMASDKAEKGCWKPIADFLK